MSKFDGKEVRFPEGHIYYHYGYSFDSNRPISYLNSMTGKLLEKSGCYIKSCWISVTLLRNAAIQVLESTAAQSSVGQGSSQAKKTNDAPSLSLSNKSLQAVIADKVNSIAPYSEQASSITVTTTRTFPANTPISEIKAWANSNDVRIIFND